MCRVLALYEAHLARKGAAKAGVVAHCNSNLVEADLVAIHNALDILSGALGVVFEAVFVPRRNFAVLLREDEVEENDAAVLLALVELL